MKIIKHIPLYLLILTQFVNTAWAQEAGKMEQVALDYLLNEISEKDSVFVDLDIITKGKTSSKKTLYREFCDQEADLLKDSIYLYEVDKEGGAGYWDSYKYLDIYQLEVPTDNSKPEKISKKEIQSKRFLEVVTISHHREYKGSFYITIHTRFLHDDQGITINFRIDKSGSIVDYCLKFWTA
jgi:hypothetical protein